MKNCLFKKIVFQIVDQILQKSDLTTILAHFLSKSEAGGDSL